MAIIVPAYTEEGQRIKAVPAVESNCAAASVVKGMSQRLNGVAVGWGCL